VAVGAGAGDARQAGAALAVAAAGVGGRAAAAGLTGAARAAFAVAVAASRRRHAAGGARAGASRARAAVALREAGLAARQARFRVAPVRQARQPRAAVVHRPAVLARHVAPGRPAGVCLASARAAVRIAGARGAVAAAGADAGALPARQPGAAIGVGGAEPPLRAALAAAQKAQPGTAGLVPVTVCAHRGTGRFRAAGAGEPSQRRRSDHRRHCRDAGSGQHAHGRRS
jgi:hypothetical protein